MWERVRGRAVGVLAIAHLADGAPGRPSRELDAEACRDQVKLKKRRVGDLWPLRRGLEGWRCVCGSGGRVQGWGGARVGESSGRAVKRASGEAGER